MLSIWISVVRQPVTKFHEANRHTPIFLIQNWLHSLQGSVKKGNCESPGSKRQLQVFKQAEVPASLSTCRAPSPQHRALQNYRSHVSLTTACVVQLFLLFPTNPILPFTSLVFQLENILNISPKGKFILVGKLTDKNLGRWDNSISEGHSEGLKLLFSER